MKLFITNKRKFEEDFSQSDSFYFGSKKIHIDSFNQLKASVNGNNSIPICILSNYKKDGFVVLDFVSKKDDMYFYEYTTTAS